jgi:hypothetical protein
LDILHLAAPCRNMPVTSTLAVMDDTRATQLPQNSCSICGVSFPHLEFSYGGRENRSYCQSCNKLDQQAYARGGLEAAREFREGMRSRWRKKER